MDSDGSIIEETKYNNTLDQTESIASSIKRKHGASESTITAVCESTGNLWLKTYQAFEKYDLPSSVQVQVVRSPVYPMDFPNIR